MSGASRVSMETAVVISLVAICFCALVGQAESAKGYNITNYKPIRCYQCNIYLKGRPYVCEKDDGYERAVKHDCFACMKSMAVTSIHDKQGGGDNRPNHQTSLFRRRGQSYSKYCITDERFDRDLGCHDSYAIGGYTRTCFCKTDLCNSATVISPKTARLCLMPLCVWAIRHVLSSIIAIS